MRWAPTSARSWSSSRLRLVCGGGSLRASPRLAGAVLVGRVGVGGCHARGRGPALAACSVAGSRSGGRGCGCASSLAAWSLAPLAAGGRARRAGRRAGARRAGAPDGVRAGAAEAVRASWRRQRDLPLDGQQRSETFTADPSDRRQVIAQAWYPTDATTGRAVPYFEAQGHLPSSIGGLPSFLFASFGSVATHATAATPVSAAQRTWPVLFFSPGLSVPREEYTALCADLASRGYVVVALSVPYESAVSVLRAAGSSVRRSIRM